MTPELDIENDTSISIDESSYVRRHQSSSVTDGNTTLPNQPLAMSGRHVGINTTQPVVTGVYGVNGDGERQGWALVVFLLVQALSC